MGVKTAYKVLNVDGSVYHGGVGSWPLPEGDRPGTWMEITGNLRACENGLHLCRRQDLVHWLGPAIFEAEYEDSEVLYEETKIVVRRARLVRQLPWDDRSSRLFAADCAKRALRKLKERTGIDPDPRSLEAVRVARRYAKGRATDSELLSAARSAAAWSEAAAARSAAAWSEAAWSEAESEREWQTKRLFKYLDA